MELPIFVTLCAVSKSNPGLFYEAICFMSYLVLLCSCVFSVLLALQLPRLGKRELIFSYVCSICAYLVSVSSSSWCLGRAAGCDCGTLWTFLLPFFSNLYRRYL